jgi:serine/threonine protein kinase
MQNIKSLCSVIMMNLMMTILKKKWLRHWFGQMIAGLRHIHRQGYAHLDLKVDNILLD